MYIASIFFLQQIYLHKRSLIKNLSNFFNKIYIQGVFNFNFQTNILKNIKNTEKRFRQKLHGLERITC